MKHANNIAILDEALEIATSKGAFGRRQAAQIDTVFNILVQALKTYEEKEAAEAKEKAEEHVPDLGIYKEEAPKPPKHKGN